jgi:hypothetical protein
MNPAFRQNPMNMMAQPITRPAMNMMVQPITRPVQIPSSQPPMQLNPYMQDLMRNYGYNPTAMRPPVPATPDDFTRPILQEMPSETPLSPYMQQLLQNYRVQNMAAYRNPGGMGMMSQ